MNFRRISIPIAVIALMVVRALFAFQTPDATKAVTSGLSQ
jgi:hypothetical protein